MRKWFSKEYFLFWVSFFVTLSIGVIWGGGLDLFHKYLTIAREIVVIAAAILGITQVDKWRKERLGTDRYQIATDVTVKTLEIRNAFHKTRNAGQWPGDSESKHFKMHLDFISMKETNKKNLTHEEIDSTYNEAVYLAKLGVIESLLNDLEVLELKANAYKIDIHEGVAAFQKLKRDMDHSVAALYGDFRLEPQDVHRKQFIKRLEANKEDELTDKFYRDIEATKKNILKTTETHMGMR